jgi:glycosyltransferase involved in cell wall biosynthesis
LFDYLSEGFGLPILEAQSVGQMVITSKGGAMAEVAGNGALLVDPLSPDEIRKGILSVINDESLRAFYISKGLKNKDKYIFQSIIDQHDRIFSSV